MNIIIIVLRIIVSILNSFPNVEKKVTLELNNQYIIELNVTQFHVKEKLSGS
jgi:hypothetical protein